MRALSSSIQFSSLSLLSTLVVAPGLDAQMPVSSAADAAAREPARHR